MKTATSVTKSLTAAGTAVANYVEANVRTQQWAAVQLSGTFVGTVVFEGTTDGSTWHSIVGGTAAAPATPITSATTAGLSLVDVTTLLSVRARCSAYTSGTIVANITTAFRNYRALGA